MFLEILQNSQENTWFSLASAIVQYQRKIKLLNYPSAKYNSEDNLLEDIKPLVGE